MARVHLLSQTMCASLRLSPQDDMRVSWMMLAYLRLVLNPFISGLVDEGWEIVWLVSI